MFKRLRWFNVLGPAFVAAVAYVDPGNVAANLSAGAEYGYLLVWVLVLANVVAMLIQYESAKLGLVTGKSLPRLVGDSTATAPRLAYWVQAFVVATATDLAEVIGGAIALNILFGLPLVWGGVIVGAISMALLAFQRPGTQKVFERVILGLLATIVFGFLAGLVVNPPDAGGVLSGLVPRFADTHSLLLASSMIGATIMPHAIYLHSQLTIDRHGHPKGQRLKDLLHANRVDVVLALLLAGSVNVGLLLLAASSLPGKTGTDSIEGAHAAIVEALGPVVGVLFGVGLLASGLASTSVGAYAGATITQGLLRVKVPLLVLRAITLTPALLILGLHVNPTFALVLSQVALSFGIPFAMVPLLHFTGKRAYMGDYADSRWVHGLGVLAAGLIVALNVVLLVLTFVGAS